MQHARGENRDRWLAILLGCCVAVALGLGVARVFLQKANPPDWATVQDNTYQGYVTIDGYCTRAARFGDWLAGADGGAAALERELREKEHPTALLLPALIGALSLAVGSVPIAFLLASSANFLLLIALVVRLGRRLVPAAPRRGGLLAGVLVAGHYLSFRTAGNLILDPFVASAALLSLLLALRFCERPGARVGVALFAVQLLGTFIKFSFCPWLAAPAVVALLASPARRWRRALSAALLFGLLPLLPSAAWLHYVPDPDALSGEAQLVVGSWHLKREYVAGYLLELALLFQFLPAVFARPAGYSSPAIRALAAATVLPLAANLVVKPPIAPRLYVAPLAVLLAAAVPAVLRLLPGRRLAIGLCVYLGANLALGILGIAFVLRG